MAMIRQAGILARVAIAVAALVATAMLSTCDFLTSDAFPRWLSYVEASVDFRSIAVAQGLGSDAYIENLELAPYMTGGVDYSKVLVFASGNGTSRLILLDPVSLEYKFAKYDSLFSHTLASVTGGFLCGTWIVDPSAPEILTPSPGWTSPSVRVFRVGDSVSGLNYAVDPNSSQQSNFREYNNAWGVGPVATRGWDLPNSSYNTIDGDYAARYAILVRRIDSNQGYAASYQTSGDFTDNAALRVLDWGTATVTGPFPVADDKAWLTAGGPVAYYRDRNNRIIRYRYGTGDFATGAQAQEIDSLPFDDNDVQLLSFDPSGTWWFIYDKLSGRLYKLRTWWK